MKKLFSTPQYKLRQERRQASLERRRRMRPEAKGPPPGAAKIPKRKIGGIRYQYLVAPETFSFTENYQVTLDYLRDLNRCLKGRGRPSTYVDLDGVKVIKQDAILGLISTLDAQAEGSKVAGNFPGREDCRNLLLDSGFLNYVNATRPADRNDQVLTLRYGKRIDATVAAEVVEFLRRHIALPAIVSRNLYGTLIEFMKNTHQHAWVRQKRDNWWLAGRYDSISKRVTLAFLDNGAGIPTTIRKRGIQEQLRLTQHSDYIASALVGSSLSRSRIRLPGRGKGLPWIYGLIGKKLIAELHVISNSGYVSCNGTSMNKTDLDSHFQGTLILWDFVEAL